MNNIILLFKTSIVLLMAIVVSVPASAQQERKYIRKGNSYYEKSLGDSGYVDTIRMQKAELAYRKVLDEDIDSYEGGFNLGASLYKQKKFAEATDQYKIIASKENDKEKLAKAYHNLGNSLLMDGKLEESIEAYKNGLRNNPQDTATKYNLAVAQKLLNEADQQKQDCQNPDQQEQKDQQEKDQQDQQQQEQQKQEQEQQDQQKQEQQQAKESDEKEGDEEKQAMKEDQISKEDAERLLQAIQQDEKELQEKLKLQKKKAKKVMIEKDW